NKYLEKRRKLITIWDYIAKFLSNSVFLGVITLLQLAAGAILGANISLAFPANNYADYEIKNLAIKIWHDLHLFTIYSVIIVVLITLVRAFVDSYISTKRENEAIKLAKEQRSLPDSLWLRNYHQIYIPKILSIDDDIKKSFDSGNFDDEKIITHMLDLLEIARDMALSWDSKHKEGYAANLMLYAPKSIRIGSIIKAHWRKNSFFFDSSSPYGAKSQISGILFVAASVNSERKFYGKKENKNHTPLILPVYLDDDLPINQYLSKQRLPGAPEAFRLGSYQYTKDLLKEVDKFLNEEYWQYFSESQAQKIHEYYLTDHSSHSLISFPVKIPCNLQHPESQIDFKKGSIVAVLNVYSEHTNMLRGNANDFNEFCRHLISTLALCIAAYEIWIKLPETKSTSSNGAQTP
ncbi:hypothetical protein LFW18_003562, partial [Vibrio cholerae]|nr:hypothetical protein [Vibrio cholerae]